MALPTTAEVRAYMTDYAIKNFKYDDEVFEDNDIIRATSWAVERVLAIPPYRQAATVAVIPKWVMLTGILAQLFNMKYIHYSLNSAPGIVENGLNIREGELAAVYEKLFYQFDNAFEQQVIKFKTGEGIKGSYSHIKSPYNNVSRRDTDRNPNP